MKKGREMLRGKTHKYDFSVFPEQSGERWMSTLIKESNLELAL